MKKLILILICLLITGTCFAEKATGLRGIVVLQNSKGQPVSGAQISAFDAMPQGTESSGRFELVFTANKKAGDKVVLSVQKQGLEVVNRKELDVIIPANPDEIVRIVMCKTGERDRHARMYYEIAEKSINDSYEERLKQINEKYEKDLTEKNKEIQKLKDQKTAGLSQAKDLAEKFAEVNLDDVSALYKEAFALFQKGDIDKAIQVLEDKKMDKLLTVAQDEKRKAQEHLTKLDKAIKVLEDEKMDKLLKAAQEEKRKAQERLKKSEEAVRQSVETYILKAHMCKTRFQFDEAEKNYRKAIEGDPENFYSVLEFCSYLGEQNKRSEAIILIEKALSIAKSEEHIAHLYNALGCSYLDTNKYGDAEKALNRALEIFEKLSKQNSNINIIVGLADTLNNLGALYINRKNDGAEKMIIKAIEIYIKIYDKYPSAIVKSFRTANNLGAFYIGLKLYNKAEDFYKGHLKIAEKLAEYDFNTYAQYVGDTLSNLGFIYFETKRYNETETVLKRSVEIYEQLAKQNRDAYLPRLALNLNRLGKSLCYNNKTIDAEKVYAKALEIYEKLSKENSDIYLESIAETLSNFGILYANTNRRSKAGEAYNKALEIYKELDKQNPDTYLPHIASVLKSFGDLYSLHDSYRAEKVYNRVIEIYEKLAQKNPDTYLPEVAMGLEKLEDLYRKNKEYKNVIKVYTKMLKIYETLAQNNPDDYLPDVATTLNNIGITYIEINIHHKAEKFFIKALEIYEILSQCDADTYLPHIAITKRNLGALYLTINNYTEADNAYTYSLNIYEDLARQKPNEFDSYICETLQSLIYVQFKLLEKDPKESYKIKGLSYIERAISIFKKYPDKPQSQEYMQQALNWKKQLENTPVK